MSDKEDNEEPSVMLSSGAVQRPKNRSRKRGAGSGDGASIDDLLDRLSSMSTNDSREELVTNFIVVFNCTRNEADFYLESANWDIATAASLALDSGAGDRSRAMSLNSEAYQAEKRAAIAWEQSGMPMTFPVAGNKIRYQERS